jgi:hypothetical protein
MSGSNGKDEPTQKPTESSQPQPDRDSRPFEIEWVTNSEDSGSQRVIIKRDENPA